MPIEASRLSILLKATFWLVFVSRPPAHIVCDAEIAIAMKANFNLFIFKNLNKIRRKGI